MKVNLTKLHIEKLEKALIVIAKERKNAVGAEKKELRETEVLISDILVRHDNRLEKEY